MGPVLNAWHSLPPGGPVGGQFVGDDASGDHALLLHQSGQQALGCFGVAAALDDLIQYIAILIDGAPQPVLPTSDADDHLIQVPNVGRAWRLAAQAPGISGSELSAPPTDRLVG